LLRAEGVVVAGVLAEQVGWSVGLGVAAGSWVRVDPRLREELRVAAAEPHVPVAAVDDGVVAFAEQAEVLQAGGAAVDPVGDVVGDAPGKRLFNCKSGMVEAGWPVATGRRTVGPGGGWLLPCRNDPSWISDSSRSVVDRVVSCPVRMTELPLPEGERLAGVACESAASGEVVYLTDRGQRLAAIVPARLAELLDRCGDAIRGGAL
jgi:hypothetical protein